MSKVIYGIQQIGVGVSNLAEAWRWYKKHLGFDIRIFEDNTVAELMLPYTGGKPQQRHAALALNMQGGGGLEIWQYKERTPLLPEFTVNMGDLGIFSAKIKCPDIGKAYTYFTEQGIPTGPLSKRPNGEEHFFIRDPFGNFFEIYSHRLVFKNEKKQVSGVGGAIIGVSDIEKALSVYRNILGYDAVIYDETGSFDDFSELPGGQGRFRRMLLTHSEIRRGSFSTFFGKSEIELVQALDREPSKIFKNRFWGDLGFIHLCFDIKNMIDLEQECIANGFPFTVNSNVEHNEKGSFDMGDAAGHFSYIEDLDGTLIEFVETHRLPLIKSLGIQLNMDKRNPNKPVPNWILRLLSLKRVKNL